jgi:putative transposase
MIFGFVAKHRGIWPVAFLCEALGVSRSGFYAWLSRRPSARVWHDVVAAGIECGLHAIERLMRRSGLRARPRRRRLPIDLGDRPAAIWTAASRRRHPTANG